MRLGRGYGITRLNKGILGTRTGECHAGNEEPGGSTSPGSPTFLNLNREVAVAETAGSVFVSRRPGLLAGYARNTDCEGELWPTRSESIGGGSRAGISRIAGEDRRGLEAFDDEVDAERKLK